MKLKLGLFVFIVLNFQFLFAQNIPYYVPKSGLELWCPLNNGVAGDSSGNMRNGVLSRISNVAGRHGCFNSALYFTGAGDSLSFHHGPSLASNQFTISMWSNVSALDTNTHSLIAWNDSLGGFQLGVKNNQLFFDFNKVSNQVTSSFNYLNYNLGLNKQWHHYVLCITTGTARIYVDSVLIGNITGFININPVNNIYFANSLYGEALDAAIEDIGWWSRILTKSEIDALYYNQPITASVRFHKPLCGSSLGNVKVLVAGNGAQNYNVTWLGSVLPSNTYGNGDSIEVNQTGILNAYVQEQNDRCVSFPYSVNIPSPLTIQNIQLTQPACFGDSNGVIIESASGGVLNASSAYSYSWTPAISTSDIAYNVPAGTYYFSAMDDDGCSVMDTIVVAGPRKLNFKVTRSTEPSCFYSANGNIQVVADGGTSPYYYVWGSSNGGVTSFAGNALYCANGIYTVYVTDANNCFISFSDTFNQQTPCPFPVVIPPYMSNNGLYAWYPFNHNTLDESGFMNFGSNFGGVYVPNRSNCTESAIALNANPNTIRDSVSLGTGYAFNLNQFSIAAWLQTNNNPANHNATIFSNLNSSGNGYWIGVRNDTIVFDLNRQNGVLNSISTQSYINPNKPSLVTFTYDANIVHVYIDSALVFVDSNIVLGLAPNCRAILGNTHYGEYYAGILDDIAVYSRAISLSEVKLLYNYSPITATVNVTNNVCGGAADGAAQVIVNYNGHVANHVDYNWSPNVSSVDSAINLLAGNYQCLVVADYMNCATVNFTVTQPTPIQLFVDSLFLDQPCAGESNAYIGVHAGVGGVQPYTYLWSNGANSSSINNLSNGTYSVVVTDANNCHAYDTFNVVSPSPLQATLTSTAITCGASNDATMQVSVNGGVPMYNYVWQFNTNLMPGNDSVKQNLAAGIYTCTITDVHTCTIQVMDTILAGPAANFVLVEPRDTMQFWTSSLSLSVTSNAPVNYQWQVDSNGVWMNCRNGYRSLTYTGTQSNYLEIFITSLNPTLDHYRCILSDSLCSDTSRIARVDFEFGEGLNQLDASNAYKVFWSNEAHQLLNVNSSNAQAVKIELRNTVGQLLLQSNINPGLNVIPGEALNDGLYILSVLDRNAKVLYNTKLIK